MLKKIKDKILEVHPVLAAFAGLAILLIVVLLVTHGVSDIQLND